MEKMDYRHGKFTLLTTEIDTNAYTREDYEEWCEINDLEPGDEDDFFDYCAEETQANYEADMQNIEHCKEYNIPVVLEGTLGLWWGRPVITPERYESVAEAIQKCIIGSHCHDVLVEYEDGVINVYASHHDGTNCFTIKALSKKGEQKAGTDYKKHDIKRLPYLYAIGI